MTCNKDANRRDSTFQRIACQSSLRRPPSGGRYIPGACRPWPGKPSFQNLTNVQAQAQAADSALQTLCKCSNRLRPMATQGARSTTTVAQQQQLATQVQALAVGVGVPQPHASAGVYIFSGDNSSSPAYQLDPSSPTGVDRLIRYPGHAANRRPHRCHLSSCHDGPGSI